MAENEAKYNGMLIDLLSEKIRHLEYNNDEKRREINRQKRQIRELEAERKRLSAENKELKKCIEIYQNEGAETLEK